MEKIAKSTSKLRKLKRIYINLSNLLYLLIYLFLKARGTKIESEGFKFFT